MKAVLVGCGSMSRVWLDATSKIPDLEMVGLVDLVEESAQRRAAEYGLQQAVISRDPLAVLEKTSPDIVFDCTIPEAHFHVTLEALKHGCHVLGEKPMADTMEHAREMVTVAQATGKLYAVIQNRRYTPSIRRLRNFLKESGDSLWGYRERDDWTTCRNQMVRTEIYEQEIKDDNNTENKHWRDRLR